MRKTVLLAALVAALACGSAHAQSYGDLGLFSFERVSVGVTAVHEWEQPEGDGALVPKEWLAGGTFAYSLLYPSIQRPGTWPTSLTFSVLRGFETKTTPVRLGISVVLLRGGRNDPNR